MTGEKGVVLSKLWGLFLPVQSRIVNQEGRREACNGGEAVNVFDHIHIRMQISAFRNFSALILLDNATVWPSVVIFV